MNFTSTEQAVLKLVGCTFSGEKPDRAMFSDCDLRAVFEELKAQTVAAAVMDTAAELEDIIPDDVYTDWFTYSTQVLAYAENVMYHQSELTELFENAGIRLAILKGASAAIGYPNPMSRNMGDIDFLVNKTDFEKAYKLMLDSGYNYLAYDDDHVDHHYRLEKDGIVYELHREPAGITHGKSGEVLRRLFEASCTSSIKARCGDYEFYRLPRLQNGLVLLLHIVHHLDEGLGLRQICDWYWFVKNELTDEAWKNEFRPVLKEVGLERLAVIVTGMCKQYLGLNSVTWCDNAPETACAEMMRFVLDNGNFGRKGAQTRRSTVLIGNSEDRGSKFFIIDIFKNLQKAGMSEWKRERGTEPIKCLAWGYIPIRYIGRLLSGKRTISQTRQLAGQIGRNKSLRNKLAVYKVD